jgi:hypothetical protein
VAGLGAIDVVDLGSGAVARLVTAERAGYRFAWTSDGQALVHRDGERRLARTALDGRSAVLYEDGAAGQVGFPAVDRAGRVLFGAAGRVRAAAGDLGHDVAHGGLVTVTAAAAPRLAGWDGARIFAVDLDTGVRRTLLEGPGFFDVELSRDGALALVRESRERDGHLWLAATDGSSRRDLGVGWGGRLAPDGRRVVFVLQENDGVRFTAADLYLADVAGGRAVRLTATPDVLEIEPAFAPDGARLAYVDAATGRVHVARLVTEVRR